MKSFFIFLILMIKIYFPDNDKGAAAGDTTAVSGRYQIIETSLADLWSKRIFLVSRDSTSGNDTTYVLTGFTNHGVNIRGILSYPGIKFSRQSVTVIPEGGDGKEQWTIDMDADGTFNKNVLELVYRIFQKDSTTVNGRIKAEKIL